MENGFVYEAFNVTTEDGYIMRLDRLYANASVRDSGEAPVVLMQHGLSSSSFMWILNEPEKAPAFMLARQGVDVWLGNNRGTRPSQRHVNMTTKEERFWDFDFEEMGVYDVPATVDFILKATNRSKLDAYVGHSEGTT